MPDRVLGIVETVDCVLRFQLQEGPDAGYYHVFVIDEENMRLSVVSQESS
jgi:hypothetical protein